MKNRKMFIPAVLVIFSALFMQCSKDDDMPQFQEETKGQFALSITDAPSDDANVKGTFVTISEVKIDGKTVDGFSKQTIEISAYQKGNTKLIFNDDVEVDSYSSLTFVLDYESDASGNSPGCYVLTEDDEKHNLAASSETKKEVTISKSFDVMTGSTTSLVADFDLRKLIVHNTSGDSEYKFVSDTEMKNYVRVVKEEDSGEITGDVNSGLSSNDELYVFVYKKGEFNSNVETQGQGTSNIFFAKAVTSSKVESDGSYKLAFLEDGEYEVHIASYDKSIIKSTFKGMVNASSSVSGLFLNSISVSANAQVQLNIEVFNLL